MNIIVKPHGQELCYCRPDTTWERENKDFYVPDGLEVVKWAPIVFARIGKAGKCIGRKFASRYYDSFNFGALLYCHPAADAETAIAFSSCIDHTSLLPAPLYGTFVLESEDNTYEVRKDGEEIFRCDSCMTEKIEEAICKASQLTSLRIGDMVAVELSEQKMLAARQDGEASFSATFCGNELYGMKVIF